MEQGLVGLMAGVDEAGRGPLAGPVVAAAVILDPKRPIEGLQDSKKLSEKRREQLFDLINNQSIAHAVAVVSHVEVDRINILQATLMAMKMAVAKLSIQPDHVWIDGNQAPNIDGVIIKTIIKGDQKVTAISAASILAKVTRDRIMYDYDREYPGYGFAGDKGYGTKAHRDAISRLGPCAIHRRSFAPVKDYVGHDDLSCVE